MAKLNESNPCKKRRDSKSESSSSGYSTRCSSTSSKSILLDTAISCSSSTSNKRTSDANPKQRLRRIRPKNNVDENSSRRESFASQASISSSHIETPSDLAAQSVPVATSDDISNNNAMTSSAKVVSTNPGIHTPIILAKEISDTATQLGKNDTLQKKTNAVTPLKTAPSSTNIFEKMRNASIANKNRIDAEKTSPCTVTPAQATPAEKTTLPDTPVEEEACYPKGDNPKKRKRRESEQGINQVNILDMLNKFRSNASKSAAKPSGDKSSPATSKQPAKRVVSNIENVNKSPCLTKRADQNMANNVTSASELLAKLRESTASATPIESTSTSSDEIFDNSEKQSSTYSSIIKYLFFNAKV